MSPAQMQHRAREMGHFALGTLEHTYYLFHGNRTPYRNKTFNKVSRIPVSSHPFPNIVKQKIKSL